MAIKRLTKDDAIKALKKVKDPEMNIDIWTLELIYDIGIKGSDVNIKMTLTSPTCPYGPLIIEDTKKSLKKIGFKKQNIEIVFDPPWQPSDDLKLQLGVPI